MTTLQEFPRMAQIALKKECWIPCLDRSNISIQHERGARFLAAAQNGSLGLALTRHPLEELLHILKVCQNSKLQPRSKFHSVPLLANKSF